MKLPLGIHSHQILPANWSKRLGVSFSARNLGYLYNSLPNDVNPEGVRGNLSGEFRIRSFDPYTANYTMTINVGF